MLETSTAGSLPKPFWQAIPKMLWARPGRSVPAHVPITRLEASTNCGMELLERKLALGKLEALAAGAALINQENA